MTVTYAHTHTYTHAHTCTHIHRGTERSRIQCQTGTETMRHDKSQVTKRSIYPKDTRNEHTQRHGELKGDRGRERGKCKHIFAALFWAHTHSLFGICLIVVSSAATLISARPVYGLITATVAAVSATALQHSHCIRYRIPIRMSNSK